MSKKEELSREQIIRAGAVSQNTAVRKAFNKLKFALELAHTKDEMEEFAESDLYQLRISYQLEDGPEYENIMIRWCEDEFVLYAPRQGGTIAGKGHTLDRDPAVVYLKVPLSTSQNIKQELKDAYKAIGDKVKRK